MSADPFESRTRIKTALAVVFVILLWLAYTVLQTLSVMGIVDETPAAILSFVPGVIGVGVLLGAGLSTEDCYLRFQRLSWRGLWVLVAVMAFALAAILPVSVWQAWSWRAALIYAPASGVSQELFFRSALLPAMGLIVKDRRRAALVLHAVLFGLWHIGPLFVGAPIWAVIAVILVPFLSGLGWAWQVQHDRTVVWAMIQHSAIWVIALQFAIPD
jgi:membrane protease YdiL (CAAX protease family)